MKAKKKLFIPIAMLVLAVMAMTSTTFAWFTSNSTVRGTMSNASVTSAQAMLYVVDNAGLPTAFDGTVVATPHTDLYLRTQANWSTTAATNDFDIAPTNSSTLRMKDLTYVKPSEVGTSGSIIDVDGTDITTASTPGLYKQGIYDATTDVEITAVKASGTADYIDLTYTFWVVNDGISVYNLNVDLSGASSITSGTKVISFNDLDKEYFANVGATNEQVAQFYGITSDNGQPSVSPGGTTYYFNTSGSYTTSAANATRVLFSSVAQNGAADRLGTVTPVGIWEPNATAGYYDNSSITNQIDIQDMYVKAQLGSTDAPDARTVRYDNSINTGVTPNVYTAPAGDAPLLNLAATTNINTNTQVKLATFGTGTANYTDGVNNYYRHQINVKVWLEGWDSDCFNVILGDVIQIGLAFNTTLV